MSPSTTYGPYRIDGPLTPVRQRILPLIVAVTLFLLAIGALFFAPAHPKSSFSTASSTSAAFASAFATARPPPPPPQQQQQLQQFITPPVVGIFSQPLSKKASPLPFVWHPWDEDSFTSGTAASTHPRSNNNNNNIPNGTGESTDNTNSNSSHYYIAASYHKWVESGGMLAIPIPYDADSFLLDELLSQIHLLLLPGGEAPMAPSIQYLLNRIDSMHRSGGWFPIWGTCLGMEFLVSHFGELPSPLPETFDAENMTLPLEHVPPGNSHLYDSSRQLYEIVTTRNVTFNNHNRGINPRTFQSNQQLMQRWKITSTNVDRVGQPFVSTIEPLHDQSPPYYGTQYHPEKNSFEYGLLPRIGTNGGGGSPTVIPFEVIDHTPEGLYLSHALAGFVGRLARKSQRRNSPHHTYNRPDRFPPLHAYPTRPAIGFEQIYLVPSAVAWNKKKRRKRGSDGDYQHHHHHPWDSSSTGVAES